MTSFSHSPFPILDSSLPILWLRATQFGAYSYNSHSPAAGTLQNIWSSASVREGTVIANPLKRLGGDGVVTLTENMDQTIVGIYWAYEGTPVLGTPPRL